MKITMPRWHEDARKMREQGIPLARIVIQLANAGIKVSESRVSQVTGQNWQRYMERDRVRFNAMNNEVTKARKEGRLPDTKRAVGQALEQWKEKEMSDRGFEMMTSPDPTDQNHRAVIRCSHKDCTEDMIFKRKGPIDHVHAAKWFRDKGWFVDGHGRADLCPEHYKGIKANGGANIKTKHIDIKLDTDTAALPVVDFDDLKITTGKLTSSKPVQEMTRMDKRVIHTKLEEVYIDESVGYRNEWDDDKVADSLGVPKEWVAIVRDDSFGPEISTSKIREEVLKLAGDVDETLKLYAESAREITKMIEDHDAMVEQIDAKCEAFEAINEAMKVRLDAFDAKMKELKGD